MVASVDAPFVTPDLVAVRGADGHDHACSSRVVVEPISGVLECPIDYDLVVWEYL